MGRKVLNQINVKVLKTVQGPLDSIGQELQKNTVDYEGPINLLQGLEKTEKTKEIASRYNDVS